VVTPQVDQGSGVVVVLDDRPFTVQDHLSILQHYGFTPRVFSGPLSFANYLHDNENADIRAFVVDLHIPGARKGLSALGFPNQGNDSEFDVGIAIVDSLLSGKFASTPVIFLTAMGMHDEISDKIADAMGHRSNVRHFDKATAPHEFESVVRSISIQEKRPLDFAFGAIVQAERKVRDGDLIRIVEPIYSELVRALNRDPSLFRNITPRQWEELIAGTYLRAGFDDVILTPRSGDLGRDVVAIKHGFGSVKFIEQVKAYSEHHLVTADEVRALLGVLGAELDASKAVFTTTSDFAPTLHLDRFIMPYLPHRLELVNRQRLVERLAWSEQSLDGFLPTH